METRILLDHEPVADGGYLVRALLRLTGAAPPAARRRALNLGVVLDRSGSMHGGKLERAREAANLLVRRLGDDDVVSIVAYDDGVDTVADRVAGARREELIGRVAGIRTGGSTNLSGGWLRGRELVAAEPVDGGVNRVLLLTDGLANVGITDPDQLRDLVATAAAAGVSTTTIGFGQDYDEALLQALAEAGGGSTYYIEEPDQAPAVFETEIEGLMALAAQNVAVTVAPSAAVGHTNVLHQYPGGPGAEGTIRLELGDLYALEPRSLLVEFLTDPEGPEVDVATLTVDAHVLLADGGVEKRTATLPIRVTPSDVAVVEPEVRREALLLEAARARKEALEDRTSGRFDDAARKLRGVAEALAPHAGADPALQDEIDDLQDMARRFDEQRISAADAKYMHHRVYSHMQSKRAQVERLREDRARKRRNQD